MLAGNAIFGKWFTTAGSVDFTSEATRIAASLVHNGTFSNPYGLMQTGPSAHLAPAYPALYAVLMLALGTGTAAWWAIRLLTIAAYALQLAVMVALARKLKLDARGGAIACVLGCLIPLPGSLYKWEAVFTGLVLVVLAILTASLRTGDRGLRAAALLGSTWGLAL